MLRLSRGIRSPDRLDLYDDKFLKSVDRAFNTEKKMIASRRLVGAAIA